MDYSKIDIVDVGLSVQASAILLRAGIITVEDMFKLTEEELATMCDANKSSLDEILAKKNECANGTVTPFEHREKRLAEDAGKQTKASSATLSSEHHMQTAQQSQAKTSSTNRKVSNVENKRAKLDAFVLELQRRYPEGSKLPTSILELFKDNKDLPINNAGSWSMAVYQTTLSAYLRERHLLGDNPTIADRQEKQTIASVRTASSAAAAQTNLTPQAVPPAERQRSIQDKERLDTVITVLRGRYPNMASEGTLANLKRNNPDLNIGSLTGLIKRVSGLTPTEYFKKQRFVVPINIYELGLNNDLQWSLQQAGVYYIGDLMKLTAESISRIPNLNQIGQIQVRNLQIKCRIMHDVDVESIGLSKRILATLHNNKVETALEIIGGGNNYSGIGTASREEILRCIENYIRNYYRARCGNVRLNEIGISNRVLSALSRHGIVYMYEAMDGCIELSGIGAVSATEILNCIDSYLQNHPAVEEAKAEEDPIEIAPTIDDEAAKADALEEEKAKAREKLAQFITELETRYPEDAEKETVMFFLRKNNSDLPVAEADNWCRLVFEKPLKDYLQEKALLGVPAEAQSVLPVDAAQPVSSEIQPQEESDFVTDATLADENVTAEEPETVEGLASPLIQEEEKAHESVERNSKPEEIVVFSNDELQDLAKKHSEQFEAFATKHQVAYSLEHFNEFFRTLYVRQENRYLKNAHGQSYGDYLIRNGIIPYKPAAFWKDALLDFLKEKYLSCDGGILVCSMDSYQYDPLRNLCRISTALFDGINRISNLQIGERYSGKLDLKPVYNEVNGCETVQLLSNGKVLGNLGKTMFRTAGIGAVLAQALLSRCAAVRSIRLSNDDLPNAIIELQFH